MSNSIIKLKNVSKFYYSKGLIATGFSKINLEFKMGEFVAITGESGSGKSTLLNVISGLDSYEEGEMYINGEETSHYVEKDFENYRRKYIGNIFQNFNLVNSYTVYQNVELVLLLNGEKKKNIKQKVIDLIKKVDLYKFRNTKVSKLSGGQKQRVSIARALAKDTPIIIADEPTGNLDSRSSESIIKLLSEVSKDKLVIIVTHNYEQVEKYVTRKIKMHDGKVLEDKRIKEINEVNEVNGSDINNIRFMNKLRLGIRNSFNIVPKFLLVLAVFFFIVISLMSEYSSFKEFTDINSQEGWNDFFRDTSNKRIIIKKNDGYSFTQSDYDNIKKITNVDYIVENDLLIDTDINIFNGETWLYGNVKNIDALEGNIDLGRLPENENEIVIEGNRNSYYLSEKMINEVLDKEYGLYNEYNEKKDTDINFKIVGIKYNDDKWNETFYLKQESLIKLNNNINKRYSDIKVLFKGKYIQSNVVPTNKVKKGKVYISENYNYLCKKYDCSKEKPNATLELTNKYYKDKKVLKVDKVYNKKNFKKLTGLKDYNSYSEVFFVNKSDYDDLFNKGYFQSSVYVKDTNKLDETDIMLKNMGYNTLKIKNALIKGKMTVVLEIFRTIVTIVLIVVLFFISYFVIKIILKSRNVYFTTIRMLGSTKEVSKELLLIELLNVANIAYFVFIVLLYLNYKSLINIELLNTVIKYLVLKEYIFIYLVLMIMSCLISVRFSKKLFKNSVMVTLNEEV